MKKKIFKSAWDEANGISVGLYRMNAMCASAYAFTVTENRKGVCSGEFMYRGEDISKDRFDGYIDFTNGKCIEL